MRRLLPPITISAGVLCAGLLMHGNEPVRKADQNSSVAPVRETGESRDEAPEPAPRRISEDVKRVKAEILSRVKLCREELQDYWDQREEAGTKNELTRAAEEAYSACRAGVELDDEQMDALFTAEQVLGEVLFYYEGCGISLNQCHEFQIDLVQKIWGCFPTHPLYRENFIWVKDDQGQVAGAVAPGFSFDLKVKGSEQVNTVTMRVFYASETGQPYYDYTIVSGDRKSLGRAGVYFETPDQVCTSLRRSYEDIND